MSVRSPAAIRAVAQAEAEALQHVAYAIGEAKRKVSDLGARRHDMVERLEFMRKHVGPRHLCMDEPRNAQDRLDRAGHDVTRALEAARPEEDTQAAQAAQEAALADLDAQVERIADTAARLAVTTDKRTRSILMDDLDELCGVPLLKRACMLLGVWPLCVLAGLVLLVLHPILGLLALVPLALWGLGLLLMLVFGIARYVRQRFRALIGSNTGATA